MDQTSQSRVGISDSAKKPLEELVEGISSIQNTGEAVELCEVKKYDNSTFLFNQIKADKSSESIKTVTNNAVVEKVIREVKTYMANDHFKLGWEASRELYDELSP